MKATTKVSFEIEIEDVSQGELETVKEFKKEISFSKKEMDTDEFNYRLNQLVNTYCGQAVVAEVKNVKIGNTVIIIGK